MDWIGQFKELYKLGEEVPQDIEKYFAELDTGAHEPYVIYTIWLGLVHLYGIDSPAVANLTKFLEYLATEWD